MSDQSNSGLSGPDLLAHFEDNWQTEMGAAIIGKERVVLRGRDLLSELNNHRWMELMVFAITGKESKKLARLVEAMWVISTSFPDPRLWNNRVAALGGTARTTGSLAVNAGCAISEANAYGIRVGKRAMDLLLRFKKKLDDGAKLEDLIRLELKQYRVLSGFGRPLVSKDERVEPLIEFATSMDAGNGPYLKLALDISNYLSHSRYKYQINISAVMSAIFADEGVPIDQGYYLITNCFLAGMFPCYIDAKNHPEGTLFPLSTPRINYTGKHSARSWASA